MNPCISRPRRIWKVILPMVLVAVAIGLPGNISAMVRAGDASLEFVGNLIQSAHGISLDKIDPTYPRCF